MVIFVCSPYGGKRENVARARDYCRREVENGNSPIAPHLLLPQFMDEKTERWEAIQIGLGFLANCDALHVYGDTITGA